MELRVTILAEHSKAQTNKIIKWVGHSQTRFDELMNLFLNEEYRIIQRAGWPLSYIVEKYPDLVKKHIKKLIDNLSKPKIPEAVVRNTVRILQFIKIPEKYNGKVIDLCINYLIDNNTPVAIKSYSLIILKKLTILYPDIKHEVQTIIEDRWDVESPAFHAQARCFLDLKR